MLTDDDRRAAIASGVGFLELRLRDAGSYLFDEIGWMDAADVASENGSTFLTVCTPEPAGP